MGGPVVELLADLARLGIEVVPHGPCLRYRPRSALTPELAERLKIHKVALLAFLRPAGAPGNGDLDLPINSGEIVEECDVGDPCPTCRGLMFWWNCIGDRRCMACDPPRTAIRWLKKAARLRRRYGLPDPPGAPELLGHLKRIVDTCNSAK